jgi:hypothetical protein
MNKVSLIRKLRVIEEQIYDLDIKIESSESPSDRKKFGKRFNKLKKDKTKILQKIRGAENDDS